MALCYMRYIVLYCTILGLREHLFLGACSQNQSRHRLLGTGPVEFGKAADDRPSIALQRLHAMYDDIVDAAVSSPKPRRDKQRPLRSKSRVVLDAHLGVCATQYAGRQQKAPSQNCGPAVQGLGLQGRRVSDDVNRSIPHMQCPRQRPRRQQRDPSCIRNKSLRPTPLCLTRQRPAIDLLQIAYLMAVTRQ